MSYTATFTKLKSGNWGVRVVGKHAEKGDTLNVRVKKKNGDESMFEGNVIWTGNDRNSGRPCCLLAPEGNGRRSYGGGYGNGYSAPRASAGQLALQVLRGGESVFQQPLLGVRRLQIGRVPAGSSNPAVPPPLPAEDWERREALPFSPKGQAMDEERAEMERLALESFRLDSMTDDQIMTLLATVNRIFEGPEPDAETLKGFVTAAGLILVNEAKRRNINEFYQGPDKVFRRVS